MRFGSLFAGIGGMDLGLERAGMQCAWQVEIDLFCQKVLTKHWPDVPKYRDVQLCGRNNLERVDLIAGGFPCQDISLAGYGAGIDGTKSGLWSEMFRIICELRPEYVLVENVAALLNRGLGRVLGDLASIGYDAEWSSVSACSMGATHVRRRVFILAYTTSIEPVVGYFNNRALRPLQEVNNFASARADWKVRLENPSELWRGAYGLPFELERNRSLGNVVVPQVAEWIGRRILEVNSNADWYVPGM